MRTDILRWGLGTALLLAIACSAALAQSEAAATGWVPTLEVRGIPAQPEGSAQVLGERKLVKGEPIGVTIWTGRSLCRLGIGAPESVEPSATPPNVWKLTGDYLGEQNGRYQMRLTSGFTRLGGIDTTAMTTQTLSLREGEGDRVVLDALSAPVDAACPVHVVTFEARLVMQPTDPQLARARYAADLWFVHRDPDGHERREHLVTNVNAGAPGMPFVFSPLTFPLPAADPRQGNTQAAIRLSGSLRVHPLANGDVVVDLDVNRPIFGLDNADKPPAPGGSPLRMTLTVKNEETAAVDFPPPSSGYETLALGKGSTSMRAGRAARSAPSPAAQPTDAVRVKDDQLVLYTFQFFKGHWTRLLLTLKRLS